MDTATKTAPKTPAEIAAAIATLQAAGYRTAGGPTVPMQTFAIRIPETETAAFKAAAKKSAKIPSQIARELLAAYAAGEITL